MTCTIEERLASLIKTIEGLTKCAHEQNVKLSKLTNKMDNMIEIRSIQAPLKLSKIQDEEFQGSEENVVDSISPRMRNLMSESYQF
ncbi:hypothetical protein H5410_005354 [Solanum commersonii]|uniref:Uncharacterized protein n=1 Tax=Solanum commersonii TaxID=4109 RepID=A0A9J6A6Z1_SOLCO|nr:hypothetical protein H5410_005354 [Solanum commersonii]